MQHFWGQDKWTDALQGGLYRSELSTWVAAWLTTGHWPGQRHYPCKCIHFETLRRCYKQFASFQSTGIAPAAEFWTLYSVYCILDSLANRSRNPYSLPCPAQARRGSTSIPSFMRSALSAVRHRCLLRQVVATTIQPSCHPAFQPSDHPADASASQHLGIWISSVRKRLRLKRA